MSQHAVLIVAASGRALAASARRGGFVPLVADWFGDQDTLAAAAAHRLLARGLAHGMEADAVLDALDRLAHGHHPIGVVCGTGFEDRAGLLARIAARWPLIGNNPEVVARAKDPAALAALCAACGAPHPAIAFAPPPDPAAWLTKRRGGSGGGHIQGADAALQPSHYVQRRVSGRSISALVVGDGRRTALLGFSEQWCAPTARKPFRYGGAVTPASIPPHVAAALTEHVHRLVAAMPLVGLNSLDFMLDGETAWLLDVNPRPGATLDVFEPEQGSLFAWHVAACSGSLPAAATAPAAARASMIVYADRDIPVPALDWPDWVADRPQPGGKVNADDPLCTVLAAAPSAAQARRQVTQRAAAALGLLRARAA